MLSPYVLFFAVVVFISYGLVILSRPASDPREPRYVYGSIPYLSHSLGLMKDVLRYYQKMSDRVKLPIFTLPVPGTRLYVISSPQLVQVAQKMPRELAFAPVAIKFSTAMSECSQETTNTMYHNMSGEHGDQGYSQAVHKTIREALVPGPKLNESVRPMICRIAYACDMLAKGSSKTINLAGWLQHEVAMATGVGVWGPDHPLMDRKVERAFWDFQDNLYGVLIGFMPSITARRAYKARQICADAFYDYFSNMRHERHGSELTKIRYKTSRDFGVSVLDIAKLEVLNIIATITNTYPTIFWMTYYVFSQPNTLAALREEVERHMESTRRADGSHRHVIDLTRLKTQCPLLLSTMQETLRVRSVGGSFRLVMQDTLLAGQYLLKKGGTVVLPSLVYHNDTAHWGANADEFDPRRFIGLPRKAAMAFRAFGGGQHLCPGRHFATTELLAIAAMLLIRFDLVPDTPGARWPPVRAERIKLWAQLTEPEPNLDVKLRVRDCWRPDDEWEFVLSDDADAVVRMTLEDRE